MGGLLSRLQDRIYDDRRPAALFRLGDMDAVPIRRRRDRREEVDARLVGVVEMIELAGERAHAAISARACAQRARDRPPAWRSWRPRRSR